MAEFPAEGNETTPALTPEEMEADVVQNAAQDIPLGPPESGIIDDCSINVGPFHCTNVWQEVTPRGGDKYLLLQVAAGFDAEDPDTPGMILVWAERPEPPETESDLWAGDKSFYRAPPTEARQLRIVSGDGHTVWLAENFANIGDPPLLAFDLDTRTFQPVETSYLHGLGDTGPPPR